MLHHIAAAVGCLVCDLEDRLSFAEYLGWCQYFRHLNMSPEERDAERRGDGVVLKGFDLGQ